MADQRLAKVEYCTTTLFQCIYTNCSAVAPVQVIIVLCLGTRCCAAWLNPCIVAYMALGTHQPASLLCRADRKMIPPISHGVRCMSMGLLMEVGIIVL